MKHQQYLKIHWSEHAEQRKKKHHHHQWRHYRIVVQYLGFGRVLRTYNRTTIIWQFQRTDTKWSCRTPINIAIEPTQQVYRRRYKSRRSLKPKLHFKKQKHWRITIFNMADGIITPCNVARSWHWFRQVTAPCNVACGWNHDSEFTKWQHPATWRVALGWQPCNSPKRPLYWNSTSSFDFDHITAVDMSLWFCTKSDHPQMKKMTLYRSSIDTIALNCLVFEKIAFLYFGDRQTNKQTNRWTAPMH